MEVRILSRPAFWVVVVIIFGATWLFQRIDLTDPLVVIPIICSLAVICGVITWHWIIVPNLNWDKITDYGGILLMILTGLILAAVATPVALAVKILT